MDELEEEVLSINAIYGECMVEQSTSLYVVHPPCAPAVSILVSFPSSYPASAPSVLQLSIPDSVTVLSGPTDVADLNALMRECFRLGEVCVFNFLDELNDVLMVESEQRNKVTEQEYESDSPIGQDLNWVVSDMVEDRRSKFVGRAIHVNSVADARAKLAILKRSKRIAKATHNMTAWRIKTDKEGVTFQDCDDDGESAAGGRLLHLLTDVWNVMVVVTRWFGGTHIGPDRFKHINVTARDALVKGGFAPDHDKDSKKKSKKSKR
ncbi:ribosomal protein S5 domain 2-type protein [Lipomyces arxii]|uniref:ribosomal protein S5 domain 2-type protein n=1 Tax=Lipomyces arxii TaxID=56418 RepID=UPI0034CF9C00